MEGPRRGVLFQGLLALVVGVFSVCHADLLSPDYIEMGKVDVPITEGDPNVPNVTLTTGVGPYAIVGFVVTPAYPAPHVVVADIALNTSSIKKSAMVVAKISLQRQTSVWSLQVDNVIVFAYYFGSTGGPSTEVTQEYIYVYGKCFGSLSYQDVSFGGIPLPSTYFLASIDAITGRAIAVLSQKDETTQFEILASTGEIILVTKGSTGEYRAQKWSSNLQRNVFDVHLGFDSSSVTSTVTLKYFRASSDSIAWYIVAYGCGFLSIGTDGVVQYQMRVDVTDPTGTALQEFEWVRYAWNWGYVVAVYTLRGAVKLVEVTTGAICAILTASTESYFAAIVTREGKCVTGSVIGEVAAGPPRFDPISNGAVLLRGYFLSESISMGGSVVTSQKTNGGCGIWLLDKSGETERVSSCGDAFVSTFNATESAVVENYDTYFLYGSCSESFSLLGFSILCDDPSPCASPSNNSKLYYVASLVEGSVVFASSFTTPGAPPVFVTSTSTAGGYITVSAPLCGSVTLGATTKVTVESQAGDFVPYFLGELDELGNCVWLELENDAVMFQAPVAAAVSTSENIPSVHQMLPSSSSLPSRFLLKATGLTPSGTSSFFVSPLTIADPASTVTLRFGEVSASLDLSQYDLCSTTDCKYGLSVGLFRPLNYVWSRDHDGIRLSAVPIVFEGSLAVTLGFQLYEQGTYSFVLGNGYAFFFMNTNSFTMSDGGSVKVTVDGYKVFEGNVNMTDGRPRGYDAIATSGLHIFSMVAGAPVASFVFTGGHVVLSPELGYRILSSSVVLFQGQYCGDVTIAGGFSLRGVKYTPASGRDWCVHDGVTYEWRYFLWILTKVGETKLVVDAEESYDSVLGDNDVFIVSHEFLSAAGAPVVRMLGLSQSRETLLLAIVFSVASCLFILGIALFVFCRKYKEARIIKREFRQGSVNSDMSVKKEFLPDSPRTHAKKSNEEERALLKR